MKKYVAGLMFTEDRQFVALIKKNKPDWQKGLLNGIGGKIEESDYFIGETKLEDIQASQMAMVREFEEETSVIMENQNWFHFLTMGSGNGNSENGERSQQYNEGWQVDFWRCFSNKCYNVVTKEDEEVNIYPVEQILELNTIDNLKWIILLALDNNPKITNTTY